MFEKRVEVLSPSESFPDPIRPIPPIPIRPIRPIRPISHTSHVITQGNFTPVPFVPEDRGPFYPFTGNMEHFQFFLKDRFASDLTCPTSVRQLIQLRRDAPRKQNNPTPSPKRHHPQNDTIPKNE